MPVLATYFPAKVHEPKTLLFISHKSGLRWDAATNCSHVSFWILLSGKDMMKKTWGVGGEPPGESAMTQHPGLLSNQNSEKCMKQLGKEWTCLIWSSLGEFGRFGRFGSFLIVKGQNRVKGQNNQLFLVVGWSRYVENKKTFNQFSLRGTQRNLPSSS